MEESGSSLETKRETAKERQETNGQEVDILLTGVTGFVGRFVLYQLLETQPALRIAVIIRASGKKTAAQRFHEEIVGSTLFAIFPEALKRVLVIDAALENLEHTTLVLSKAHRIIHCAANVKHYDPYEALERDNVHNVRRILRVAEDLSCDTLTLLSTCYVHPQSAQERPPERVKGVRDDFYNDYCYTKWLGEEAVHSAKTRIPYIEILRLSCVGAPIRPELAIHPCAAQAHLGIASLAFRGYLEGLTYRPNARISTIPVDIIAAAIVESREGEGIAIQQICAPPAATAYHIPLPKFCSILRDEYGMESFLGQSREDTDQLGLPWWKQIGYRLFGKGRQALKLHENVQDFVATFTDTDIRFVSSLPDSAFPTRSEEDIIHDTCKYAVRILHHRQLAKGVPMNMSDRFWHRLANGEQVQACIGCNVPIDKWPTVRQRLWEFFITERKYTSQPEHVEAMDRTTRWRQVSGHSLDTYISQPISLGSTATTTTAENTDRVLAYGLRFQAPRSWHILPFQAGEGGRITHILISFDHGLSDGVGLISRLPDLMERILEVPQPHNNKGIHAPRRLPLWMDLWMGIVYLFLMVSILWTPAQDETNYSREPTIATGTFHYTKPPKPFTVTTELLWKLTQWLGTGEHILTVPALTKSHRPATEMSTNAFTPILLPVSSTMSEAAFLRRCNLLHAKSVRFLSWCIQRLIEWGAWDEIRDLYIRRSTCIVSCMQTGSSLPENITIHGCTTTPAPIPYSVVCITSGDRMMLTVRSHNSKVDAHQMLEALGPGKK